MITFKDIDEKEMQYIIDNNEVSDNIKKASENVLAIFTQDWCGDWKGLERELKANEEKSPIDITIFICMYNQSPLYEPFMNFKETVWNNGLIPYLRYYKNGSFVKDTNHLPFQRLIKAFE
ncbi:hypothetical protein R4K55_00565 [Brachyspira alvinipulli]|uniref:hypothetical protein n=1 Tax=Brachyspira alvinipulli TaxID=84379 RepID=UPI00260F8970|nr:hypothetical protein [uncultured Brachyspira sp.]